MKSRTASPKSGVPAHPMSVEVSLLEQLFDLVPEMAFFLKDGSGRYVAINQSLATRHGLQSKLEAIGKTPREICPGEFGLVPTEQDAAVLATGKPLIEHLEYQWHLPHEPVWCLTTKLPIRDPQGNIVGIVGFSRDVRVPIRAGEVPRAFARALADFEKELPADCNPAWLARRARMTPQRLARLTRRIFDLTPSQLISKTRMMAASRMLLDTPHSVSEVAHACGFYDHSAFSRSFRSATGLTPTEFRNQWRKRPFGDAPDGEPQ